MKDEDGETQEIRAIHMYWGEIAAWRNYFLRSSPTDFASPVALTADDIETSLRAFII
jgi:hypothetical protein